MDFVFFFSGLRPGPVQRLFPAEKSRRDFADWSSFERRRVSSDRSQSENCRDYSQRESVKTAEIAPMVCCCLLMVQRRSVAIRMPSVITSTVAMTYFGQWSSC